MNFTGDQQLMSEYIYILMTYRNGRRFDQWGRRMIGHVIDIDRTELVKWTIWIFGDKLTVSVTDIDFKEVVIWSLIVRSDSCDWRCGRMSRWAGFREKRRWSDDGNRRLLLKSWRVHYVKDRLQVTIWEPVEVDDYGDIFGRQRMNGTYCIFVRWTLLATRSKHHPHALHDSSLA